MSTVLESANAIKKEVEASLQKISDLSREKKTTLNSMLDFENPDTFHFKIVTLRTVIEDQEDAFEELLTHLAEMEALQKESMEDFKFPVIEKLVASEQVAATFVENMLVVLRSQKKSLRTKGKFFRFIAGRLLKRKSMLADKERFLTMFSDFADQYKEEVIMVEKAKSTVNAMTRENTTDEKILERARLSMKELEPYLQKKREEVKAAMGNRAKINTLMEEFDQVLKKKLSPSAYALLLYKNAKNKWIVAFTLLPLGGADELLAAAAVLVGTTVQYGYLTKVKMMNPDMIRESVLKAR